MNRELEDYLWERISYAGSKSYTFPKDVIDEMLAKGMIQSKKEALATLAKWTRKGMYSWGSVFDLGWKVKKDDP